MDNLFITKKEQVRLEIFKFILFSNQRITFLQLKKNFHLSQASCYRYISQLEEDINFCFQKKYHIQLQLRRDKSYTIVYDENLNIHFYVNYLRLFYMQKNTKFRVLNCLMNKKYKSIDQLSYELNLSKSTIYKQITKINHLAKRFDIVVSCNYKLGNIRGEEKNVRLFYFLILWEINSTFMNKYMYSKDLSVSQKNKLELFKDITVKRLSENKKIDINNCFIDDTRYLLLQSLEFVEFFDEKKIIERERLFFSYIIRFIIPEINHYLEKESIVYKYKSNTDMGKEISLFIYKFMVKFNVNFSEKNYIELYFIMIIYSIYFKYFDYNILEFYMNNNYTSEYLTDEESLKILESISTFLISEYKFLNIDFSKISISSKNTLIYTLFFFYSSSVKEREIHIYISYSKNLYTIPTIKSFISNIYGDKVKFVQYIDLADIIISDTFEGIFKNKGFFYFNSEFNKETWKEMSEYINHYFTNSFIR